MFPQVWRPPIWTARPTSAEARPGPGAEPGRIGPAALAPRNRRALIGDQDSPIQRLAREHEVMAVAFARDTIMTSLPASASRFEGRPSRQTLPF